MPTSSPPFPPALPGAPRPAPGSIGQAVLRVVATPATVTAVRALSARVRLLTLRSPAFDDRHIVPGDKLQVCVGGLAFRTYTPLRLDDAAAAGTMALVACLHGGATPGAKWLAAARAGDACHVRGPRRSIDIGAIERSTVFFGDETTFGLAAALCATPLGGLDAHFLFEVDDPADARRALDAVAALGPTCLRRAQLVRRRTADAHLEEVEELLAGHARADAFRQYVLAGHACAIRQLVRRLRREGVRSSQLVTKAYWSPGKVGLD